MKKGSIGGESCTRNMEGRRTGTKVEEGRTIGPEGGEWIEGRLVKAAF